MQCVLSLMMNELDMGLNEREPQSQFGSPPHAPTGRTGEQANHGRQINERINEQFEFLTQVVLAEQETDEGISHRQLCFQLADIIMTLVYSGL